MYVLLFLTAELDGGEWSTSRPGRFTSGRRLEGLRSSKGVFEKKKISYPNPGLEPPDLPACSLVTILLTLFWLPFKVRVRIAMWRTLKLVKYNRLVFSAKLFNR